MLFSCLDDTIFFFSFKEMVGKDGIIIDLAPLALQLNLDEKVVLSFQQLSDELAMLSFLLDKSPPVWQLNPDETVLN
jgi:hypothetical protein